MTVITIQGLETMIPEELLDPFPQEAVDAILSDVADATRDWWVAEAMAELHTSRADYIHGLQPVEMSPGVAVLTLVGVVPNLVEQGQDAVDMRTTLLGPNVPISEVGEFGKHLSIDPGTFETGFYRAIPFRHEAPGGAGFVGKPMPKDVYAAAKRLRAQISGPFEGTTWAEGEKEEKKPKRLGAKLYNTNM
jgi:hypothetical protein